MFFLDLFVGFLFRVRLFLTTTASELASSSLFSSLSAIRGRLEERPPAPTGAVFGARF